MTTKTFMLKDDVLTELSERAGVTKAEAEKVYDVLTGLIEQQLRKGRLFRLLPLGQFEVAERPARMGRNPQTGEDIEIAATRAIKFKASAGLKRSLNH